MVRMPAGLKQGTAFLALTISSEVQGITLSAGEQSPIGPFHSSGEPIPQTAPGIVCRATADSGTESERVCADGATR